MIKWKSIKQNLNFTNLIVPVGEGAGLGKLTSFSGMFILSGAIGLWGKSSGTVWRGGELSSINDWKIIFIFVLGNLKIHLKGKKIFKT